MSPALVHMSSAHARGHGHDHGPDHAHGPAHEQPLAPSLLRLSAPVRLGIVVVALAALWAGVFWALRGGA